MSAGRYLSRLFESVVGGFVELRSAPSGQRCWTTPGRWAAFGSFITAAVRNRQDVYCGLATRRNTASGTESNLLELPGLFLDIDQPPEVVRPLLAGFPFQPAFVVSSGAGTHATWLFKEPLDVSTVEGIKRAAPLCRRAAAYFKADDRATSPAVAPRLPNSRNFKYGRPQPVTLLEEHDTTVNAGELEDFLPREIVDRKRNAMTIGASIPVGSRHDVLFSLTRSLLCHGVPFDAVSIAVRSVNERVCAAPLPESELRVLLHDALVRPHRHGFTIPTVERLILHDLTVPSAEEKEQTLTADELVTALVSAYDGTVSAHGGTVRLDGLDVRHQAQAAGIHERTLRRALHRAGLRPVRTGRGVSRQVSWQFDKRTQEVVKPARPPP